MSPRSAAAWIEDLGLLPHPEGGYYRETHRSPGEIGSESLPPTMQGSRSYVTAIYYLLEAGQVSRFHRICSDELWFFHSGDPLEIVMLNEDGALSQILLGPGGDFGQRLQAVVPAEAWFGARPLGGFAGYALVSCVVAPGFSFEDFQLASPEDLQKWPNLGQVPELCPPLH